MSAFDASFPTLEHPVAFIGGGNMARSLIGGLVARGAPSAQVRVADPNAEIREALVRDFGVQTFEQAEDAGRNVSANPTMGEVIAARYNRRDLMRGARERSPQPDPAERVIHGAIGATAEAGTSSPGAMTVRTLVPCGSGASAERYFSPTSARLTSATTRSSAATTRRPGGSCPATRPTRRRSPARMRISEAGTP